MAAVDDELQEQQKQNIFGGITGALQGQQGTTPGDQPVTSQAGAIQSGPASSQGQIKDSSQPKAERSAIFERNIQRQEQPKALEEAKTGLGQAKQELQSQADQFVQQKGTYDSGITSEGLKGAVEQGQGPAFQNIMGIMGREDAAPMAEQFRADVRGPDISTLRHDPGEYFRKQAGPQYSAGEKALDVALLRGQPEFNLGVADLERKQRSFQDSIGQTEQETQQRAEAARQQAFDKARSGLRSQIVGEYREPMVAQLQNKVNTAMEELRSGRGSFVSQEAGEELQSLIQSVQAGTATAEQAALFEEIANSLDVGAEEFYQGPGELGIGDVMSQEEEARFANISNLLGDPSLAVQRSGRDIGPGFDEAGYQQALAEAFQGARGQREEGIRGDIAGITSPLEQQAQALTGRLRGGAGEQAFANREAEALRNEFGGDFGVDPTQFVSSDAVGMENLLNQEQADRLNKLYAQLGDVRGYGAGAVNPNMRFDADAYRNALESARRQQEQRTTVGAPGTLAIETGPVEGVNIPMFPGIIGNYEAQQQFEGIDSPTGIGQYANVALPPSTGGGAGASPADFGRAMFPGLERFMGGYR